MRLFIFNGHVINVDNDKDAERVLSDPLTERELNPDEITATFSGLEALTGPDNTQVKPDGTIIFDQAKAALIAQDLDREIKKVQAKKTMETTLTAGVVYNDKTYACQKSDIASFTDGLTLLDLTQKATIEAYDRNDTPHTLTSAEYREVCRVVGLTYYEALRAYKSEIKASEELIP